MNTHLSKTISIVVIVSLMTAGAAFAQNQKGDRDWQKGPPRVEEKLARISAALDLSDQQSIDMLVILQEQEEKRTALHDQSMLLMGPEICAQRAEAEDAILAILTPEQVETFLQIREERQDKAKDRGHGRKGRRGLDCSDYEGGDS
jgi:Spy/CpxP family protein refolding chaperone